MGKKPIGYIDATTSTSLSKVMDRFLGVSAATLTSFRISIDGTVALQGPTLYSVPLNLILRSECNMDCASDVVQIHNTLKELTGWKTHETMIIFLTSKVASKREHNKINMNFDNIEVTNQIVRWEDTKKNLDAIFDQLANDQLKNLPPIPIPPTMITPLLDHQLDGIRWLYKNEMKINSRHHQKHQELSEEVAVSTPFYQQIQEGKETVWLSEITKKKQKDPPEPMRGSIL